MKKLNLNTLDTAATKREGGKKSISVAQMKEARRCIFLELQKYPAWQVQKAISGQK